MTRPIKYAKHKNSSRVYITLALTWIISVGISSPIALGMNYTDRRAQTPTLCTFYNSDFLIYSSRIRPRIADWPAAKPPACRTRLVNTLTSRSRPICWPRLQSGARVSRPTFPSRFRYRCQLTAPCVPHLSSRTPGHRRLDATKPTAWRTSIVAVLLVFGLESRRDQFWSVWVVAWLTPVRAYLIYSSMGSFYIPCVAMLALYWKMFRTIRERARQSMLRRRQTARNVLNVDTSAKDDRPLNDADRNPVRADIKPNDLL